MTNQFVIEKHAADLICNLASLWANEVSSNRKPHFVTVAFAHKRLSERWDHTFRLQHKQLTLQMYTLGNLRMDVHTWYNQTYSLLLGNKVVPKSKIQKFMNLLVGSSAVTASEVAIYCDVSHDTAARWLKRADERLKIFNLFTFGNKHYYLCIGTLRLAYDTYLNHFDLPNQVDDTSPMFWELPRIEPDQNGERRITDFKLSPPPKPPF